MYNKRIWLVSIMLITLFLAACGGQDPKRVCAVLDSAGESNQVLNEFTMSGARDAAEDAGLDFTFLTSETESDYEVNINDFAEEGCDLIITAGPSMAPAAAAAARENDDIQFVSVEAEFLPGDGCDGGLTDCYEEDLANMSSLIFAEDEVGYLVGVLAGCTSDTGIIGSISGRQTEPDVKYVIGYQTGAKSQNPDIETLNVYIRDDDDPSIGQQAGQAMLDYGADIIFGIGETTGKGGLQAAHEAGKRGIGINVDQYFTYPEVASSMLSSALKNYDVLVYDAILSFADDELESGIRTGTIANRGLGLAPFHDQDRTVSIECEAEIESAEAAFAAGQIDTGYRP